MSEIRLVFGDDDSLRGDAARALVTELLGGADPGLAVDRLEGEDYEVAQAADAAGTPPFLSERRVVLVRHLGRFAADELAPLVRYLADPLPTTALVLVWERSPSQTTRLAKPPKALVDGVTKAGGELVDTSVGTGRARRQWLDDRLGEGGVRFDRSARDAVAERLGDDVDRVNSLVATIEAAYGATTVGADDVEPFLGEAGGLPPWELTDAIDKGDIATALDRLHRMLGAGGMHALQVMAILTTHFRRILALEGSDARNEQEAAEVLGTKPGFPIRKALTRAQRMGYDNASDAVRLLSEADVDLRGAKAWPDELVLEVLVARLARLSR
jgi:DNA polymerase III subunit delta